MKKTIISFIFASFFAMALVVPVDSVSAVGPARPIPPLTVAAAKGSLIWQVNGNDYLWYVHPASGVRYLISSFGFWAEFATTTSVAINQTALAKIGVAGGGPAIVYPNATTLKYRGLFVRTPSDQVWYVNPRDNRRYLIDSLEKLKSIAQVIGRRGEVGVLRQLPLYRADEIFDPFFTGVAAVRFDGNYFYGGQNDDRILPIASLTKVMTAMVFRELDPDWGRVVTITPEQIDYPRTLVGNAATSEVGLQAGDRVSVRDLWVALLSASSNQSAVILADNSGVSRAQFVELMNQKAFALGLTRTKFYEMSGLDVRNVSTAREMAMIARAAFADQSIAGSTQVMDYAFWVTDGLGQSRAVPVRNRNYSLLAFNPQASKTGYLTEAQRNVVMSKGGSTIAILHAGSMIQRNDLITQLLAGQGLAYER